MHAIAKPINELAVFWKNIFDYIDVYRERVITDPKNSPLPIKPDIGQFVYSLGVEYKTEDQHKLIRDPLDHEYQIWFHDLQSDTMFIEVPAVSLQEAEKIACETLDSYGIKNTTIWLAVEW